MSVRGIIIFGGLAWYVNVVLAQTLTNAKQLYLDVFANHQKEVIPSSDQSKPLEVIINFYLMTITRFDEIDETIVIVGAVSLSWIDGGISWDPADYGNQQYMTIPQKVLWTPQMVLLNAVNVLRPIEADNNFLLNIDYNGNVSFTVGDVLSAKCTTDISRFPFDSQSCYLQFAAWGLASTSLNLTLNSAVPVDLAFYTPDSDWNLQSYSGIIYIWNGYSTFKVTLEIKRKPLYYSIVVIIPTFLFGLLNPLVFVLPVESGERIGLAMTILLSYAIFLTLVSAAIPASSNPMSIMLIFMIITIVWSGLIVVATICSSALYYRNEKKTMNKFWKFIGKRCSCSKKDDSVYPLCPSKNKEDITSNVDTIISWKDVSYSLDMFCLTISVILMFILGVTFFLVLIV